MCPHLDRWFDTVMCRDNVTHIKPDPRHLTDALDSMAVAPGRAAMVGDGAMDMHSGRRLSMFCVGVLTGSSDADRLVAAGADLVLDSANELPRALPVPP